MERRFSFHCLFFCRSALYDLYELYDLQNGIYHQVILLRVHEAEADILVAETPDVIAPADHDAPRLQCSATMEEFRSSFRIFISMKFA